jgi:hypothetical protein
VLRGQAIPPDRGGGRAAPAGQEPNRLKVARLLFDDGLRDRGFRYRPDHQNPFSKVATGQGRYEYTDRILYPRELLQAESHRRGEDCDGLTVLYASLLLNWDIDVVLLDAPGHLFLMFDTGWAATRANEQRLWWARPWQSPGSEKRLWQPVEMTVLAEDVLQRLASPSAFAEAMVRGCANYDQYQRQLRYIVVEQAWENGFRPPPLSAAK